MASFLVSALLASVAVASPLTGGVPTNVKVLSAEDPAYEQLNSNWAGAVLRKDGGTFQAVTGSFKVPKPTGEGSAAIWVGVDGMDCGVILQTGVDASIKGGQVSYSSWYEWFPDPSYTFDNIDFAAGDDVTLTATTHSTTTGTVTIENKTKNQKVTKDVSSTSALCQKNAEWIVEDYSSGGLVEFDNFGTVTFTSATATTGSGSVGPDGATIVDIAQNGTQLTQSSVANGQVTIKHT
ncbi:hypothetical protein CONPUDRAFT_116513 [Coniophora puteana RWD-64-598 SS2]|uniref:Uncharacterized protein n=1 Tax=Coniophora puteana (strain RWD-64-598) TaxID=741705 RepID=A0A5M3N790_CONPW|nr:uncharacterized protein CONPUDRAFT_116513 [Coniophora puteana RWD-64-598 SS2]EIW87320.1 hypothetical protein CONPUDRAFT_116513 [Coniophora puteana RWD-64-598 SS2]